jgi:SlyX protein
MEERLNELEIKLSLTEDLVEALNRTVFRQQQQLDLLQEQLRLLYRQFQAQFPGPARPRRAIRATRFRRITDYHRPGWSWRKPAGLPGATFSEGFGRGRRAQVKYTCRKSHYKMPTVGERNSGFWDFRAAPARITNSL